MFHPCFTYSFTISVQFFSSNGSQTGRRGALVRRETLPRAPRKHAKVVAFVAGHRALGVWCRVRSVLRNFIMEKYCLEELLVNSLRSHTSQSGLFARVWYIA